MVLLNKICLIRDKKTKINKYPFISYNGGGKGGRGAQLPKSVYVCVYIDFGYKVGKHTSIPNVGIRVIICIMRQNVKKIPATMVVIVVVVVVVAGLGGVGGGYCLVVLYAHNQNQNQNQ